MPDYYIDTPAGCVFVSGYWDYPLPSRGYLYAPVYFYRPVVAYRPWCQLNVTHLFMHLFVNTYNHHYYFGDYYDVGYRRRGCYPIYDFRRAACRYDPLYTFYNVHYARRGIDCRRRFTTWHNYYVSHKQYRPPRTLAAQISFQSRNVGRNVNYSALAPRL